MRGQHGVRFVQHQQGVVIGAHPGQFLDRARYRRPSRKRRR